MKFAIIEYKKKKKQYGNRKIYKFEDRKTKKQYKLRFLLTYIQ